MSRAPAVRDVPQAEWRDAVLDGAFLGLWADRDAFGDPCVAAAVEASGAITVIRTPVTRGTAPTVVDLLPAAEWDEREAHDLAGIGFDGHAPMRPLVVHPPETSGWATPVVGNGVHQVAVGPIHAGIIESGHFRFHVVGERIVHLDVQLFYKHRGLEAAAVGADLPRAVQIAQRACAACAVTNTVAVAQACEASVGLVPDEAMRRSRTVLIELERLYNHLNDIGAICAGIGFAAGTMAFADLKERAQRVNVELTGHRFLFDVVDVGRSRVVFDGATSVRAEIAAIAADAAGAWDEIARNRSVRDRVDGAGTLRREAAAALGTVGPAARASGVAEDVRTANPGLWYPGFVAAGTANGAGDVAARMSIRVDELAAAAAMLDELLSSPVGHGQARAGAAGPDIAAAAVEGARGRTLAVAHQADGRIRRLHLRTASFANWRSVAAATADAIVPDFPLINKSFELCYACADR
jgi:Ni,Fe-hydrogenase III large subunit